MKLDNPHTDLNKTNQSSITPSHIAYGSPSLLLMFLYAQYDPDRVYIVNIQLSEHSAEQLNYVGSNRAVKKL